MSKIKLNTTKAFRDDPGTKVGTIDLTPTWQAILPTILEVYKTLVIAEDRAASHAKFSEERQTKIRDIETELKRMAQAADLYNEIPSEKDQLKTAELKDLNDNWTHGLITPVEYNRQLETINVKYNNSK